MTETMAETGIARDTSGPGPLAGVRVIELGMLLAGPFTGRLLGDLGAEIIKVEPPGQPDPLREWGKARYRDRSLWWPVQGRNKKCVTLNLREEAGPAALARAREAQRRARGELPSRNARAVERRPRAAVGGESEARRVPRVGLRPDGPVRASCGLRLGGRGDGRHSPHQRLRRRASAAHPHLARRLARRHVRRHRRALGAVQARLARLRPRPGGRRVAARVLLRAAREHRAGVRPAQDRARSRGHRSEGRGAVEHLQVLRRQVDRDRSERRQRLPPALRGDGTAGARGRPALQDPPRPRRAPGGDRGTSWPSGRGGTPPPTSTGC